MPRIGFVFSFVSVVGAFRVNSDTGLEAEGEVVAAEEKLATEEEGVSLLEGSGNFSSFPGAGGLTHLVVGGCATHRVAPRQISPFDRAAVRCCSHSGRHCATHALLGSCVSSATFDEANAVCARNSLRLCSQYELEASTCCGTGCGFDGHSVWTNTPVSQGQRHQTRGMFVAADGCRHSRGSVDSEPRDADTGVAAVRCCSNDGRRCETSGVGCLDGQNHLVAEAACSARGLRLCTEPELDSGVCCGTGCGFDGRRVWTSTPAIAQHVGGGVSKHASRPFDTHIGYQNSYGPSYGSRPSDTTIGFQGSR